ncbi:MAG: glycosyl transferase, partial [Chloroflexales bacterium]
GYRVGGAEGLAYLRVRMYTSGREVVAGLTKNAAAGYRNGGGRSLAAGLRLLALAYGPLCLLGGGTVALSLGTGALGWVLVGLGVITLAGGLSYWGTLYRRLYGLNPLYGLIWPFGLMTYLWIAVWGMWRVRSGQGVVWKGRTYTG